jgi:hypothetical protein
MFDFRIFLFLKIYLVVAVDRERFEDSNVVTLEDLVAAHDLH